MRTTLPFARIIVAVAASLLGATPLFANEPIDFGVVAGLPRAANIDGRSLAWRNVTVRMQSEHLDISARFPSCVRMSRIAAPAWAAEGAAECLSGSDYGVSGPGAQYAVTLKVPQWIDRGPLLDVVLRQWNSSWQQDGRALRGSGRGVELALTQPLGTFDLLAGVTIPFSVSSQLDNGRSAYAGVAWRPQRGTTLELTADATDRRDWRVAERAYTVRYTQALPTSGLRLAIWTTRFSDERNDPWRAGLGLEYRY